MEVSIIIPVYNEERTIASTIEIVKERFHCIDYEIIVVNDASTDDTANIIKNYNVKVINNIFNRGYGASVKTALREAKGKYVITIDGDGQHNNADFIKLYNKIKESNYDMVVGERPRGSDASFFRFLGKKIILLTVNTLIRAKIYDFNSGLRIFKREIVMQYIHLFPNGFSITTTMTVAFFRDGYNVAYVPIVIKERQGKSTVGIYDAFISLMSVFRLIMIFSPLNLFLPVSFSGFVFGVLLLVFDLLNENIQDITVLVLLFSGLIFFFGLIVDQMAHIRREIKR